MRIVHIINPYNAVRMKSEGNFITPDMLLEGNCGGVGRPIKRLLQYQAGKDGGLVAVMMVVEK